MSCSSFHFLSIYTCKVVNVLFIRSPCPMWSVSLVTWKEVRCYWCTKIVSQRHHWRYCFKPVCLADRAMVWQKPRMTLKSWMTAFRWMLMSFATNRKLETGCRHFDLSLGTCIYQNTGPVWVMWNFKVLFTHQWICPMDRWLQESRLGWKGKQTQVPSKYLLQDRALIRKHQTYVRDYTNLHKNPSWPCSSGNPHLFTKKVRGILCHSVCCIWAPLDLSAQMKHLASKEAEATWLIMTNWLSRTNCIM